MCFIWKFLSEGVLYLEVPFWRCAIFGSSFLEVCFIWRFLSEGVLYLEVPFWRCAIFGGSFLEVCYIWKFLSGGVLYLEVSFLWGFALVVTVLTRVCCCRWRCGRRAWRERGCVWVRWTRGKKEVHNRHRSPNDNLPFIRVYYYRSLFYLYNIIIISRCFPIKKSIHHSRMLNSGMNLRSSIHLWAVINTIHNVP